MRMCPQCKRKSIEINWRTGRAYCLYITTCGYIEDLASYEKAMKKLAVKRELAVKRSQITADPHLH